LRIAVTEPDPEAPPPGPDASGRLTPLIETSYFSDDSFPFSDADRNDLLDGYSMDDSAWQGDFEGSDSAVKVEGIEDLFGSVAAIEARVMQSEDPDGDEIRAGSIGACFLAVLVHQAVRETVRKEGLPRALCVMAGNDGVYPFFDAPVLARDEYPEDGATMTMPLTLSPASPDAEDSEPDEVREGPYDFSRLSSVTTRKVRKMPVIMLDAAEADLATHQFDAGTAQQLAEIEATDAALLVAPAYSETAWSPEEPHISPHEDEPPVAVEAVAADPAFGAPLELPESAPLEVAERQDPPIVEPTDEPLAVYEPANEPAAFPEATYDHEDEALPVFEEAASETTTSSSTIRALRARLTVEVEPEQSLGDRIMGALRKVLGLFGLH
jgi:hypothetical protein